MSTNRPAQHEPNWNDAPDFGRRESLLHTMRRSHQLADNPPVIVEIGTSRDERPEACNGDGWSTRAWGWYAGQQQGSSSEQRGASSEDRAASSEERLTTSRLTTSRNLGRVYTVDIDPEAIEACKRITAEQADTIEYVVSDSLEFFQNWNIDERGKIDLLYLDGLDYFDHEQSESHILLEAKAALPLMAQCCLVLFDDTTPDPTMPPHLASPTSLVPRWGEEVGHPEASGSDDSPAPEHRAPTQQCPTPNTQYLFRGKGARAIPFLLANGFVVEFDCGGQVLLSRGAEDIAPEVGHDRVSAIVTERLQAYSRRHWLEMPALCTIGGGYREFEATADAQVYLDAVARLCSRGGDSESGRGGDGEPGGLGDRETGRRGDGITALEIGPTSAYAQAYLARRGVCASGVLFEHALIERARQAANWLGCDAGFMSGGLFSLYTDISRQNAKTQKDAEILSHKDAKAQTKGSNHKSAQKKQNSTEATIAASVRPNTQYRIPNTDAVHFPIPQSPIPYPFRVIFHSNLAAALPTPWLLAMLSQQAALANWVVFSVDSVFAEQNGELDEIGCRRLTPEMWQELLSDFEIGDLRTYGATGKERILITLRGVAMQDQGQRTEDQAKPSDLQGGPDDAKPSVEQAPPSLRLREKGDGGMRATPPNVPKLIRRLFDPFPFGISLIIHTRSEAHQIIDCINSAAGLADEIIVCDMESTDGTPELVAKFAAERASLSLPPPLRLLRHPRIDNFDSARNSAGMFARYRFVFYLDADERLPIGLAAHLRRLLATQGHLFEAMALPFHNMFCGKELGCIYGYKAASIYKNGYFFYNARPHQGARIDGRVVNFPADSPALALIHLTYPDLPGYIRKMDGYSSTEAANMKIDRLPFHWQQMLAHSVQDMAGYDLRGAMRDGPHGLLWMLCSGFYRIAQYGKHWQQRYESGEATAQEASMPGSLEEVLEFMLAVARDAKSHAQIQPRAEAQRCGENAVENTSEQEDWKQGKQEYTSEQETRKQGNKETTDLGVGSQAEIELSDGSPRSASHCVGFPPRREADAVGGASPREISSPASVCWFGPVNDPSGYGEEVRSFLFACDAAGIEVAARAVSWGNDQVILTGEKAERMQQLLDRPVVPGYIQIIQNFPQGFVRDPNASIVIGRTMFETDRVPPDQVRACNQMDYIWVPSEFAKVA